MTQLLASTPFLASFKASESGAFEDIPLWLKEARRIDACWLDSFELPSFRDEEWKYTPLTSLWRRSFDLVERLDGVIPEQLKPFLIDGARNVLVLNGHYAGEVSSLPAEGFAGVTLLSGGAAYDVFKDGRQYFSAVTRNDAELFCRLNRQFLQDPLAILVKPGTTAQGLVHILNVVTSPGVVVFPRIFIRVGQGAALNVLQSYLSLSSLTGGPQLNVPVTDIVLEAGGGLEYGERHLQSVGSSYIGAVRVWQKSDSSFKSMMSTTGAGIFRSNISVMLEGAGASAQINGLHDLHAEAHADSHTFLEHLAPDTKSDQLYKCILYDAAHSVFNGRVFVRRDAQKTSSYQLNKNLLLSRECRVDTKPQLEIMADDVKCTHGATISQLDEEQLFYLQTRAVGREDSVGMLVRGFMDDVLSTVSHPLIRKALMKG